jgi:hypothetical protein
MDWTTRQNSLSAVNRAQLAAGAVMSLPQVSGALVGKPFATEKDRAEPRLRSVRSLPGLDRVRGSR